MSLRPVNNAIGVGKGETSFGTIPSLTKLIVATGDDNVQAQAVLAAEHLGTCIPVSPERIDEAVDALSPRLANPFQILSTGVSVGVHSGGLCKVMRESTPLLQFFLLCAACKTTLVDEECSKLIYEMMKTSQVLTQRPCSLAQTQQLVVRLSAHARLIAPADTMHDVAVLIDDTYPAADTIARIDYKTLAEILMTIFGYMRDEGVESIQLSGHTNAVWIITTLLWLFADRTSLVTGDVLVIQNPNAKLMIHFEVENNVTWELKVFRPCEEVVKYIFNAVPDPNETISQLPLNALKSYINQYHWANIADTDLRNKAVSVSGTIAQTFIPLILKYGRLYYICGGCRSARHCKEARISDIVSQSWVIHAEQAITKYGWKSSDKSTCDPILFSQLGNIIEAWRDLSPAQRNVDNFKESIIEVCQEFVLSRFTNDDIAVEAILDPALFIAADASLTCTTTFENGTRFIKPLDDDILGYTDGVVLDMLLDNYDISRFRESAFRQIFPGLESWHDLDVIVSRDGYVASMKVLWVPNSHHQNALSIRVQRGQLKMDKVDYFCLRENVFKHDADSGPRIPAFDPFEGLVTPEVGWRHAIKDRAYSFEASATVCESRIEIKQYMTYIDSLTHRPQRKRVSWVYAITMVAAANHTDIETSLSMNEDKVFRQKMASRYIAKDVCWTDAYSLPPVGNEVRSIIMTRGNPMVKLFAAASCYQHDKHCYRLYIRHRCPLLSCIEQTESTLSDHINSWIIID